MSIRGNWEHRRTFVKLSGAGAVALIFGYGPFTERAWSQPRFSDYPFSPGVASGDPVSDGVVLWTRLAPDPLNGGGMLDRKVPVQWQVGADEGFSNARTPQVANSSLHALSTARTMQSAVRAVDWARILEILRRFAWLARSKSRSTRCRIAFG